MANIFVGCAAISAASDNPFGIMAVVVTVFGTSAFLFMDGTNEIEDGERQKCPKCETINEDGKRRNCPKCETKN
jgi:hypothetical protein